MGREIKFRAWDIYKKQMNFVSTILFDELKTNFGIAGDVMAVSILGQRVLYDNQIILMQFTGLHDKNGKEIWEGDVLSWKTSNGEWQNSEVRFVKGGFCIVNPNGEELNSYPLDNLLACSRWDVGGEPDAEVLGNIYEHPNLREGEQ